MDDDARVAYERAFWTGQAMEKGAERAAWDEDVPSDAGLAAIIDWLHPVLVEGAIAIDLGCGPGRLLIPMRDAYTRRGCSMRGLDIAGAMTDATVTDANGYARVATITDGRTLPFDDASVAAVWSVLLFQHLPPEAVRGYVNEIARVLQPGGRFIFQFIAGDDAEHGPFSFSMEPVTAAELCRAAGMTAAAETPSDSAIIAGAAMCGGPQRAWSWAWGSKP